MRRHLSAAGSPRPQKASEGGHHLRENTDAEASVEKRSQVRQLVIGETPREHVDVSEIARRRPAEERKVRP
jgi:hypothetical protein